MTDGPAAPAFTAPARTQEEYERALTDGVCPRCGTPTTPITAPFTTAQGTIEMTRLECEPCDVEYRPNAPFTGEPGWTWFRPRTTTIDHAFVQALAQQRI